MSSTSGGNANANEDESKPLWQYVTKLSKIQGGGNMSFKCNYCNITFTGSYSRVKAHLLKVSGHGIRVCAKVTNDHLREMQKKVDEVEERMKRAIPKEVPLPIASVSSSARSSNSVQLGASRSGGSLKLGGFEPKKRKVAGKTPLENAFGLQLREQLDSEIARMFYSAGLPFTLVKNPYYKSSYTLAANSNASGYLAPGYNSLRTTLLQREKAHIEKLLKPIKSTWGEKGVTIVCDCWTDPQRRPLINFMAVSDAGPIFLKAVNCEGEYKDKYYISNLIMDVIADVGSSNVVQVITDNAPVCKAAGMLVEGKYPHIFWTPCVVHSLNLAIKNIFAPKNIDSNQLVYLECNWINDIVGDAGMVKNFILNHSARLAMFNEFSKLKLLAIADTRFASAIVMLKRFKEIKVALQAMVISHKWSSYREDDVQKAKFVREKLLDEIWWDKINYILSFSEPMYEMIRFADTDHPSLHLIVDMWETMIQKVKKATYKHEMKEDLYPSSFWNVIHTVLENRWTKSSTPLHCLAYSLNPRFTSKDWMEKNPTRTPPHKDMEIASIRSSFIKRYFPNQDDRKEVNLEFAKYYGSMNELSDQESIRARWEMDAKSWWLLYGVYTPKLRDLAVRLLGQVSSSSCCERNWSTYSFLHSLRRNKITPQRAEDLVFVHTNLRLLSRRSPTYMEGADKLWDIAGDSFDPMDDVGLLEFANLSLDEPELVNDICGDDDIDTGNDLVDV